MEPRWKIRDLLEGQRRRREFQFVRRGSFRSRGRWVGSSGLAERIAIVAVTSDIWPWYALSDALVSVSDIESLPRSFLEAMALEVPVLAADVFGVSELIEDGRSGWLFRPRDMGALDAALRRFLDLSPDARRRVGAEGRTVVLRDHRAAGYGLAYREMIGRLSPPPSAASRAGRGRSGPA